MSLENRLKGVFEKLPSRELTDGDKPIREFISMAAASGVNAFDEKVIDRYMVDCHMVENKIIKLIINTFDLELDSTYLSLYRHHLGVVKISRDKESIILADELFIYTMISFFITVFSLTYDKSIDNYKRCIKNSVVLLDLQGIKNTIGTFDNEEFNKMAILPDNIINLAMDAYWTSWTFVIAHEIFHIVNKKELLPALEEKEADAFGYKVLMQLIKAQKENKVPKDVSPFYEYLYLSPMMLLEYYKLLDYYKSLFNIPIEHGTHPDPIQRQDYLFELFDSCVPDTIDTTIGNDLYNSFLDTIDLIKEELKIKKRLGKLFDIHIENLEKY